MLAEKEQLLDEVVSKINLEKGFIIASYKNLKSNQTADFRFDIVKAGGNFFALKKRVLLKAAEKLDLKYELNELEGHIGILLAETDFLDLAKAAVKFQKDNKDTIELLGGHFEGKQCTAEEVKAISQLPSLDDMRAQILGLFAAPQTQTVSVMDAIVSSLVYCLDNKVKSET